jgi:transposase
MVGRLSNGERQRIQRLCREGLSIAAIAKRVKRSESSVRRWVSRLANAEMPCVGRPWTIEARQERLIKRALNKSYPTNERAIQEIFELTGIRIGKRTPIRYYKRWGYKYLKPKPVPMLSRQDKRIRVRFANNHKNDNVDDYIFADETEFTLQAPARMVHALPARRPRVPVVAHPAKVQVFWSISKNYIMHPYFFKGTLNAERYQRILHQRLCFDARERFTLVQDRAPAHRAHSTETFMRSKRIKCLSDFPARSPDMNVIEGMFATIARLVKEKKPRTVVELERACKQAMAGHRREIKSRINAWSRILKQVIREKGDIVR